MSEIIRIINGRVVTKGTYVQRDLFISEGTIVPASHHFDTTVDAKGHLLTPGLIDLQVNGGFGIDLKKEPYRVEELARHLRARGITAFLPTIISSTLEEYQKILPHLQPRKVVGGADILGIHLEGPYLNPLKAGCHPQNTLCTPKSLPPEHLFGSLSGVKLITLAPEMPHVLEWIPYFKQKGIHVAIGHTLADMETIDRAIELGASLVTHAFNAMHSLHHREASLATYALTENTLFYSLIADGAHVHAQYLKLALRSNPSGLLLVSDASPAAGLKEGHFSFGNLVIELHQGRAYVRGEKTLAGSAYLLDDCVRLFQKEMKIPFEEAILYASQKPALALNLPSKGSLEIGCDADIVMWDTMLNPYVI